MPEPLDKARSEWPMTFFLCFVALLICGTIVSCGWLIVWAGK
jgi:hypothetical protein